ncbi:MAG: SusC/RagA family TonB-linked outer membrane protein [Bacteroidetes bacterium]|nr:SusC/RagA family TonB-linked outer membrane protein [Bacteroidota bacterium]
MIRKIKLLLLFMGLLVTSAFSQTGTIKGVITDRATGETLPGANVLIEGTTTGVISDVRGAYSITVPAGNVSVRVSFLGYDTEIRQVSVGANETITLNFELYADIMTLSEFIVIGYGVQKREDMTGSIAVIDSRDFNKGNITTPAGLLSGKVPGVQITSAGGAPGSGDVIRIRGGSSLSASNDPLIVIDGVPIDGGGVPGIRNPLSTINPSDIESFTILKDASATAIYGSRASNGVIIITTKKGKEGMPLTLSYSGTYSMSSNIRNVDVLSADEFRNTINERYADRPNVLNLLGEEGVSTDWQKEIFQDAFAHDHVVSGYGAYKKIPYRASLGYNAQEGVLKKDYLQRVSASLNVNPSFLDNHLKVNINAKGANVNNKFANEGAIGAAVMYDPTKPVTVADTTFGGYFAWVDDSGLPKRVATSNPVALLELTDNQSSVRRLITNAQIDYKVHWLPELRANLNLALDYSESEGTNFTPDFAPWAYTSGGSTSAYDQKRSNELLDFYLNYNKDIESIKSNIDIMAAYSHQRFWLQGSNLATNIFGNRYGAPFNVYDGKLIDQAAGLAEARNYEGEVVLISFFGRLQYSLMNRYLLYVTVRNDHSSRFSPETRSGIFPSAAFAWKILEEPFMDNANNVSELKLRLGYGVTGQQDIGGYYPYLARYTPSRPGASYPFGTDASGNPIYVTTIRPEGYDRNIKWEETETYNIGLDFGFKKDRYTGSLDLYKRNTKDLINFIPVAAGSNLSNYILTNVGSMENRGIELSLFTRPISTNEISWLIGINGTYNETKISKLTAYEDPDYIGVPTGGISGGVGNNIQIHTVGFAPNSFFVYQQVYDNEGNPIEGLYVDLDGDGEITLDDLYRFNKPTPTYYFGITNSVDYKNWSFSFAGRANIGNFVYNNVSSVNGELSRLHRPEGPYLSNVTSDALLYEFNNAQYFSDFYIQDASFFKMDHITLGYNFPDLVSKGSNLNVSFVVQNAFMITGYKGLDPEVAYGVDNNIYPRPRIFVLSLGLQF